MKILHTIAGLDAFSGGTSTCTVDLIKAIHRQADGTVDLLTVDSKNILAKNESWLKAVPCDKRTSYGFSRNMARYLRNSDYDIYHTNGLWMDINHITCSIAGKKRKPYIITPHGMLYPQALARSAWKKKLLLALGIAKDLKQAAVIHATCEDEMNHYRNLGFRNPVALIPNPVPIPDYIQTITHAIAPKKIGFLGRLHPIKNIESLIFAWRIASTQLPDYSLIIVGDGESSYKNHLYDIIKRHNIPNVEFRGFVAGKEKFEFLSSLMCLCLPSLSENFGMTVTEALSVGTPVIASKGTPWEVLNKTRTGIWCDNNPEAIAEAILTLSETDETEFAAMGERGKALLNQNFRDSIVAAKMLSLYRYILGETSKPDFVYD